MAAYRRVYDSRHLQADCQESGSAAEPYARQSSTVYRYLFYTCSICYAPGHPTDKTGCIMFSCCPSVCACVCPSVPGRRYSPTHCRRLLVFMRVLSSETLSLQTSDLKITCFGISTVVEACYRLSSSKADAQSAMNWTVVGQLS